MSLRLLRSATRLAGAFAAFAMSAGELRLPPVTGELAGDFTPLKIAGAPTLHWTLALESPAPSERIARLVADGPETHARVEFHLNAAGDGTWRLTEGRVGVKPWLAGLLTVGEIAPTGEGTVQAGVLAGGFLLQVNGLDLGELLRLADADKKYFRSAQGRVTGTVNVTFKNGEIAVGECLLTLAEGTSGLVSFLPNPGLLTNYVPAQVRKLYPGLEAIELGRTPLEAHVLRLTVSAMPDESGRRAFVHLEGRPQDPKLIAPLELDINLSATIESLVRRFSAMRLKMADAK